jgi:hypothetical protein
MLQKHTLSIRYIPLQIEAAAADDERIRVLLEQEVPRYLNRIGASK